MKLKNILLENQDEVGVLKSGLREVQTRSHLVQDQIRNNIDEFFRNLDLDKFRKEFGKVKKFLGAGVFGAVFKLSGGKVLKITFDYHEAPFLHRLSKNPKEGMVEVDKVVSFDFGDTEAYGIVRDDLTPINQTNYSSEALSVLRDLKQGRRNKRYRSEKKREVKRALMSMYEMDPGWRGTHLENLGLQNGEVVLYDGFSKGVDVSASIVPSVNLQKN